MPNKDHDREWVKVYDLPAGMTLYRVVNAGGCAWSAIEDRDGCEIYCCERKHEKSMIKDAVNFAEWQARKNRSKDQEQA